MVFPGHFSTGCLRCRQRKVKCDETRPSCRRCTVYGKECTGYTDQFHFRHSRRTSCPDKTPSSPEINTNSVSVQGSDRKCRSFGRVQTREASTEDEELQVENWGCATVRSPEACYDDISLSYFVRRFVSPNGGDGFPGHLTFLPDIYDSHSHGLLETVTLSVAQMAAYNHFGGEKFRMQSYENYGRAIQMMQEIIQSEEQALDDKVITSVILLCTLKDISGESFGDPNEHASGLFYLVEKRGPAQMATSRGAELLMLALIRLQLHSFLHEDHTYSDPGAIATVWGAFDPLLRAMSMMSRTLLLRHSLLSSYTSAEGTQKHGENKPYLFENNLEEQGDVSIIAMCFEALDNFASWDAEASIYWNSMFEGRGLPTVLGEVASCGTYYDCETGCTIVLIRAARLILLMSMIAFHVKMQLVDHNEKHSDSDLAVMAECLPILEEDVGKTIDDILSSVPFALGEIDSNGLRKTVPYDGAGAIVIVHSLRLVASCAYVTMDQRQKVIGILERFNNNIGIRSAVGMEQSDTAKSRWKEEQSFLSNYLDKLGGVFSPGPQVNIGN